MSLLTAGKLAELLLRNTRREALKPIKDLTHIAQIYGILFRPFDKLLNTNQAVGVEMVAEALIHLMQHPLIELDVLALGALGEDGVDEAAALKLGGWDAAAHEQGLVGLGVAHAVDECAGGTALSDEADGGEGCE